MSGREVSVVSSQLVGGRAGVCIAGEATEFSAAGSVATGTALAAHAALTAENGGALEVAPAADPNFCTSCGWVHQERERPVPCVVCHREWTGAFHAVCDSCRAKEASP